MSAPARARQRQTWTAIGHESPDYALQPFEAIGDEFARVLTHRQRDRLDAMDMRDHRVRDNGVHAGFDRRTQLGGVQLLDHERDGAVGGGIVSERRRAQAVEGDGNHDVLVQGVGELAPRGLDPHYAVSLDRSIASRRLRAEAVASQRRR
jgi:hypothetical protein